MTRKPRAKKRQPPIKKTASIVVKVPAPKPDTVLVMRHCGPDGISRNDLKWPESGPVECSDWSPYAQCGNGLHGWLWGCGDHGASDFWGKPGVRWLVVEVAKSDVVDLGGKVKFPRGVVVHCGDQPSATRYIADHLPAELVGKVKILGGTATAGDSGTATAGDSGTATAGYRGTATAGYRGTATAGDSGTATAGYRGTATAGDSGTATAGYRGTATAGDRGTATAGDRGTATAGHSGTATAGHSGTATAGHSGTVKGRAGALLVIRSWDGNRWQIAQGIVQDGDCKPDTPYHFENGKLVEGETAEAKEAREFAERVSKMKPVDRP